MQRLTLARHAMATRFEFVLVGPDERALRAAGEEALHEIDRIESRLSLYRGGSEIARVNARAEHEPVAVSPDVFALLVEARALSELTCGTFDPTIGPLVHCWGFLKGNGTRPTDEEIAAARARVGIDKVELNPGNYTVRFREPGMMLDLGSIGKGYALGWAADILRDAGVENALLHGGTSTIVAFGTDPDHQPWKVAIENPHGSSEEQRLVAVVELQNESLSVSAIWGKYFEMDGQLYGHVIDPRTGWPAQDVLLGAVILESTAATDALSTGVLLGTTAELDEIKEKIPGIRFLQMRPGEPTPKVLSYGISVLNRAPVA